MKALVIQEKQEYPSLQDLPDLNEAPANEEIVDLKYSALNRRDYWITQGQYPGIKNGVIMGSDGMGMIKNRRVLINPGLDWGDNERVQSDAFNVLGLPRNGTFASQVVVPTENIFNVPGHLTDAEAAALPLAGLTAYRVLFSRCSLQAGDKVLISGVGGGVAHFALLFAVAAGAQVTVTSSSKSKIEQAMDLGATHGFNYTNKDWAADCKNHVTKGFDVIIDSAAGDNFSRFIYLSAPGGRIGIYGGTRGKIKSINPQILFWRQVSILGSTMGSPSDFSQMLKFVSKHKIRPIIDKIYPLSKFQLAFQRMAVSNQYGKIVLDNEQ